MSKHPTDEIRSTHALTILQQSQAIIRDSHIVYTSGRHGSDYVNKDAVYPHTGSVEYLCDMFACQFGRSRIQTVVGPALGGIILSQWTAHQLSRREDHPDAVMSVYAEKTSDGRFAFNRGYSRFVKGRRVLVVEDILTTGDSARRVIHAVREAGGEVIGLGALCNRGGLTAELLDIPRLYTIVDIDMQSWSAEECPLCAQGIPINTEVGKGREFLAAR